MPPHSHKISPPAAQPDLLNSAHLDARIFLVFLISKLRFPPLLTPIAQLASQDCPKVRSRGRLTPDRHSTANLQNLIRRFHGQQRLRVTQHSTRSPYWAAASGETPKQVHPSRCHTIARFTISFSPIRCLPFKTLCAVAPGPKRTQGSRSWQLPSIVPTADRRAPRPTVVPFAGASYNPSQEGREGRQPEHDNMSGRGSHGTHDGKHRRTNKV